MQHDKPAQKNSSDLLAGNPSVKERVCHAPPLNVQVNNKPRLNFTEPSDLISPTCDQIIAMVVGPLSKSQQTETETSNRLIESTQTPRCGAENQQKPPENNVRPTYSEVLQSCGSLPYMSPILSDITLTESSSSSGKSDLNMNSSLEQESTFKLADITVTPANGPDKKETTVPMRPPALNCLNGHFSPKAPLSPISPGVKVFYTKDLKFDRALQRGGQGLVQLAATEFHPKVAVKVFLDPMDKWTGYEGREFKNLVRAALHPNLVQIRGIWYDSEESERKSEFPLGYVMEYMQEGSLHDVIHKSDKEYGLPEILNWTRQAASALCYLHEIGLIHRDVKPENMLVANQGKLLKLCDLGLSKSFETNKKSSVGTLPYMAPEVMMANSEATYSESCDVYSLAISMWEMYHRSRPFGEFSNCWTFVAHVTKGGRPAINEECNSELSQLIKRCWSAKCEERLTMNEIHSFAVEILQYMGKFEEFVE